MSKKRKATVDKTNPFLKKRRKKELQLGLDTRLLEECFHGRLDIVLSLVNKGASTRYTNSEHQSSLYIASAMGHADIVRVLASDLSLQYIPGVVGAFPQHIASDNGHLDILQELLSIPGAPQNQTCRGGRTPVYMCAQSNRHHALTYLLQQTNANPLIADTNGVTPLAIAAPLGCLESVESLIKNVNKSTLKKMLYACDCAGYTPLHTASWAGHVEIVALLLENGADPTLHNMDSERPLDLAKNITVALQLAGNWLCNNTLWTCNHIEYEPNA